MPEPVYSVLQVLPGLEQTVREYFPRCTFFVGEDEQERNAQPPKMIWDIDGGDPTGLTPRKPEKGMSMPRPFAEDWVQLGARCYGAAAPSTAVAEQGIRAQEFAASEYLMYVLRWALKRSTANGWLGAHEWLGWKPLWPEGPSDRGCPIDCTFRVKVTILAPQIPIAEPPLTQEFFPITLVI